MGNGFDCYKAIHKTTFYRKSLAELIESIKMLEVVLENIQNPVAIQYDIDSLLSAYCLALI